MEPWTDLKFERFPSKCRLRYAGSCLLNGFDMLHLAVHAWSSIKLDARGIRQNFRLRSRERRLIRGHLDFEIFIAESIFNTRQPRRHRAFGK